jgi:hypothetical protein
MRVEEFIKELDELQKNIVFFLSFLSWLLDIATIQNLFNVKKKRIFTTIIRYIIIIIIKLMMLIL